MFFNATFTVAVVVDVAANNPQVMMLFDQFIREILFSPSICVLVILLLLELFVIYIQFVLLFKLNVLYEDVDNFVPLVLFATFTLVNVLYVEPLISIPITADCMLREVN